MIFSAVSPLSVAEITSPTAISVSDADAMLPLMVTLVLFASTVIVFVPVRIDGGQSDRIAADGRNLADDKAVGREAHGRLGTTLAAGLVSALAAGLPEASADALGEAEASVFLLPAHPASAADRTNTQIRSGMIFLFIVLTSFLQRQLSLRYLLVTITGDKVYLLQLNKT